MPWLELTFPLGELSRETAEDLLERVGALAVTHRDAGDHPVLEPAPGEIRLWAETHTTALFETSTAVDLVELVLRQNLPGAAEWFCEWRVLDDRCWERAWMDDFGPMRFGQRLWIQPSGCELPEHATADAVVVSLDPGLAFGTGTHATTALCLEHLDQRPPIRHTVLDFGCGSGVLAIAALKLGASSAIGVDIDPQALSAAAANAERNEVGDRLILALPVALPVEERYQTVLANILSGPLVELSSQLSRAVKSGGELVLSGILERQVDEVLAAYSQMDPKPEVALRDGWARIRLVASS
jgi:ribosomal protein L11 methyltransferase